MADLYLKIDGIPGEVTNPFHKDEIQVESWGWGEKQSGTMAFGGGGGAGKVQMQDATFTMNLNKASPKLFLACATGQHISRAVLTARKAGGAQVAFLKFTFTDFLVSSYETGGESTLRPVETIGLNFSAIEMEYKVQNADGSLGAATKVSFDQKQMKSK